MPAGVVVLDEWLLVDGCCCCCRCAGSLVASASFCCWRVLRLLGVVCG